MMNAQVQERWVEALKSEKYKQGKLHLRDSDDNFCCLGVLCDIFNPNHWKKGKRHYLFLEENYFPSYEIQVWSGLNKTVMKTLADMNDAGHSFLDIAHYIKKHI